MQPDMVRQYTQYARLPEYLSSYARVGLRTESTECGSRVPASSRFRDFRYVKIAPMLRMGLTGPLEAP